MDENLTQRKNLLKQRLESEKVDSLLISSPANKFYFTNWPSDSESGFLLLVKSSFYLLTDSRYVEEAKKVNPTIKVIETRNFVATIKALLSKEKSLGLESDDISVKFFKSLKKVLVGVRLVPSENILKDQREVKDFWEISLIKKAALISQKAFSVTIKKIKAGITESEISWELEKNMRELGSEKTAWSPFIVASGPGSSVPHYRTSQRKIGKTDTILLDFGSSYHGYSSDLTRMVFLGRPEGWWEETYKAVFKAQKLAISMVKAGVDPSQIDRQTKASLRKNFDQRFIFKHALGHGLGLQVHELPIISSREQKPLTERSVITIEPGIYLPGRGGVRLEDVVLVGSKGPELISSGPPSLEESII